MAARIKAVAVVQGQANIRGVVTFEELPRRSTRYISNKYTVRGRGDLRQGCDSLCDHFNPDRKVHGGRDNNQRHAGDLGNILADEHGHAYETFTDNTIQLRNTKYNIIGRSVVIHQDGDDLGRGGDRESLLTGNAGARIACGVIGYAMC